MKKDCAQTWIEKAMKYDESSSSPECKHERNARVEGEDIANAQSMGRQCEFIADSDALTMDYYRRFREHIPTDDPLWLFYGPKMVAKWIDCHFYYGVTPYLIEESMLHGYSPEQLNLPGVPTAATCYVSGSSSSSFRSYMREKLIELMGPSWSTRLKQSYHVKRDIEYDMMRFLYHTGDFDPDNYELDDTEQVLFRDEGFLEKYMSWS